MSPENSTPASFSCASAAPIAASSSRRRYSRPFAQVAKYVRAASVTSAEIRQETAENVRARMLDRGEARHERAHARAAEYDAPFARRIRERTRDARIDRARVLAR